MKENDFLSAFGNTPSFALPFLLYTHSCLQSLAGLQGLTTYRALSQGSDGAPAIMLLGKSHNPLGMQAEGGGGASDADAARGLG